MSQRTSPRSGSLATATLAVVVLGLSAALATTAEAGLVFDQGFETDTAGWNAPSGYGSVTRVSGPLTPASGSYYAQMTQTTYGPYTAFDHYRSAWPGTFAARIDVYLDPGSWANGEGFDYSTAINKPDGTHRRDFIFHVTQDTSTGDLLVGGSNNTNFNPREDLDTINHYTVTAAGWYTLESVFRDFGDGSLAVDLNLRDASNSLLFTETRHDTTDILGVTVGGNRYGWFTNIDVAGGISVDNVRLDISSVPEPSTLAMGLSALLLGIGYSRRRRRAAYLRS